MSNPNKIIVKQIENYMSQLPNDEFLQQCLCLYAKTHDIVAEHRRLRNQSVLLGKCLKARFGGGGGNPARQLLDTGMIDRWESEYIWALVDVYQALFELIQMAWEDIKVQLSFLSVDECPSSETDLFLKILCEHYDCKFIAVFIRTKYSSRVQTGYKTEFRVYFTQAQTAIKSV